MDLGVLIFYTKYTSTLKFQHIMNFCDDKYLSPINVDMYTIRKSNDKKADTCVVAESSLGEPHNMPSAFVAKWG